MWPYLRHGCKRSVRAYKLVVHTAYVFINRDHSEPCVVNICIMDSTLNDALTISNVDSSEEKLCANTLVPFI